MDNDTLWRDAVTNLAKLGRCPRPHDFVTEGRSKYRCTKCGGEVGTISALWYMQGAEDAANSRAS